MCSNELQIHFTKYDYGNYAIRCSKQVHFQGTKRMLPMIIREQYKGKSHKNRSEHCKDYINCIYPFLLAMMKPTLLGRRLGIIRSLKYGEIVHRHLWSKCHSLRLLELA
jgi:hypothetical protein